MKKTSGANKCDYLLYLSYIDSIPFINRISISKILSLQFTLITYRSGTKPGKGLTVTQKHSILRGVFKHGLTYHEGAFRTPSINPALAHNAVKFKEKGLLFVEQSSNDLGENPLRSEIGS